MTPGRLFVMSGPSGAGKSSLTKEIIKRKENLYLATSATTRSPRKGEKNRREYYFLSIDEFKQEIDNQGFLEFAEVHGNYYGTLKKEVENKLNLGKNILLEIDVQGGEQIKKIYDDAVLIFIKTANEDELKKRLHKRATDTEEIIQKRLENSIKELNFEKSYDYTVINIDFEKAVEEILKIMSQEEN